MRERVRLRDVLNPNILNDADYVGFQGDSEFVGKDGKLHIGSWTYKKNLGTWASTYPDETDWTLDSQVDVRLLFGGFNPFEICNDNGELCLVEFHYSRE